MMMPKNIYQDLHAELQQAGLAYPKSLKLGITQRCNIRCHHCWLRCDNTTTIPDIPKAELERLIKEFTELGGREICIAGGETFLHKHWFEVLEFCCIQAPVDEVIIQTNGLLLDARIIGKLKTLNPDKLRIHISVDGASEESHDIIRGTGTFKRTTENIRELSRNGLGKQTCVVLTEMEHNFLEIPDLLLKLQQWGVGRFFSNTLIKDGRAAESNTAVPPQPDQITELLRRYKSDSLFRKLYQEFANVAAIEWYNGKQYPAEKICTCIENPYITVEGTMFPCSLFLGIDYAAHDVFHQPLIDTIRRLMKKCKQLPQMAQKRKLLHNDCTECAGFQHCGAGCMGRALAAYGDPLEKEDRCSLRRAVYADNA